MDNASDFRVLNRYSTFAAALVFALAGCFSRPAVATLTTLDASPVSIVTRTEPVTLNFPLHRGVDLNYDVALSYHTVDGTAMAGSDYTAASGTVVLPAGTTDATIPVTIAADSATGPAKTFQLVLDGAVGIGSKPDFAASQGFATGARPESVVLADINGDGKPDAIVANFNDDTVSVMLNVTAPGAAVSALAAQQTFATGARPVSVTAVDVNADGRLDLVATNALDNTVSVLINLTPAGAATATFATQQTFSTDGGPAFVSAADFNGDGRPDLAVVNAGAGSATVLLNTTAPGAAVAGFTSKVNFAAGLFPFSGAARDVNGDGKVDLIIANQYDGTFCVLLNTTVAGSLVPAFAAKQTFSAGPGANSVAVADMNGDGKPDVVVANQSGGTVSVSLNGTAPGATVLAFSAAQHVDVGGVPDSVVAVDVSGDGKPDLLVANAADDTISVIRNATPAGSTTTSFVAALTFATDTYPVFLAVADMNGDGKPDVVAADMLADSVSILLDTATLGTASVDYPYQPLVPAGTGPLGSGAGDFNGDGKPDIAIGNFFDDTFSVMLNVTDAGATVPAFATQQTFATGARPYSVAVADLNGDGKPDVAVANSNDNNVSVFINTTVTGAGSVSFSDPQTLTTGASPRSVVAADVNGDGAPDLIVADSGSNLVSVLLNSTPAGSSTAAFAPQQTLPTGGTPSSVAAADANGDGRPDLIVADFQDDTVSVLLNTTAPGSSAITFSVRQSFATGDGPIAVTTGDVDGDGRQDLIVANNNGFNASVLLNTTPAGAATPSFAPPSNVGAGAWPAAVVVSDINGDGKPDVIIGNSGANSLSAWLNTTSPGAATPTFSGPYFFVTGPGAISVAGADFNGDGLPDFVVADDDNSSASVLLSAQYRTIVGSAVTGTIVHDHIFAGGFD